MSSSPYAAIQDFVAGLPELVQPLMIGLVGMIPYVEGEGSVAIGILVGINPIVATIAAIVGNVLAVAGVVLLTSRVRSAVVAQRGADWSGNSGDGSPDASSPETPPESRKEKGRKKIAKWVVRFGVPGASILAPIALPTHLTAAFLVGSGVSRGWVMLWQIVAIVLWTSLVAAASFGAASLLGLI